MGTPAVDLLVRVGLATLLGLAIGVERQWRSRMAGLQTMALISMASALYLILGAYGFHRDTDPTRVAAQIVTGVGFLGAGAIMKQGLSVTGLNTAATMWASAAVGALAGAWAWREAVAGAAIIIAANGLLQPLAARIDRLQVKTGREAPPADYVIEIVCATKDEAPVRSMVVEGVSAPGLRLESLQSTGAEVSSQVRLRARLSASQRDDTPVVALMQRLGLEPAVRSVRWSIENESAAGWVRGGTA